MRHTLLILVLVLLLVACGQEEASTPLPTRAQTVDAEVGPRTVVIESTSLPPTWTPAPLTSVEHLAPIIGPGVAPDITGRASYVVQPGDTLGEIATQYGVTVSALASANRITNIDVIEVGMVLIIPDS